MKIKDFNLSHFDRVFVGDNREGITDSNYEIFKEALLAGKKDLSLEDKEVYDILVDSLNSDKKLPFELTPQEINFLKNNDVEIWSEYLIFRYKLRVFPALKKTASFPVYLLIEPVSACNLRCVMCFQSDKTFTKKPFMGVMKLDTFKKIIDEAHAGGTKAITLASRGEPTLNKHLAEMLEYTKGKFLEVKVNTNATLLTDELCHSILSSGVTELVFSIDSAEKELYENIRLKGKFDKVIENIKNFHRIKEEHYSDTALTTTASGVFFHEKQDMKRYTDFFKKIVDNVAVVNIENRWNTYTNDITPEILSPCEYLWQRMYIWYDGVCNPCDVDYKSFLKVGNINDSKIQDVWLGERYQRIREDHINKDRLKWMPCDRCGLK